MNSKFAADKKKNNLLFVIPSLRRAGAETQAIDLINTVDAEKYNKTVAVLSSNIDQIDSIDQSMAEVIKFARRFKFDLSIIRNLSAFISSREIDIIHCTLQFSLLIAWLAVFFSKKNPKLIVAIHTTLQRNRKDEILDRYLYRYLLARCSKIIFVCQAQADYWVRKFPEISDRAEVVYNGIDVEYFKRGLMTKEAEDLRQKLMIEPSDCVLTCVAGFRPEKGHRYLLHAFAELAGQCQLILAGDGEYKKEMESLANVLNISDKVHFIGSVSDIRPVLELAHLSILASTAVETFSIAMLESMSMRVPMLATDIGGLKEAISPGKNGELVPIADQEALTMTLKRMILGTQWLERAGISAREVVVERFTIEKMVFDTEHVMAEALKRV